MVIGREKGLEKGKNYLLIEGDDAISRQHIEITMIGGVFKIKNISKSNETCVGEQELGFGETANLDGRATVRLGPDTTIEMESLG
jgi:predicted component of type VI protein secretion system